METRKEFIEEYEKCKAEWAGMLIKSELPALSAAVNEKINEISLMRNLFTVEEMSKGAKAIYPVPDKFVSPIWVLPGLGYRAQDYMELISEEVTLPMFTVQAAKDWLLKYDNEGRVDIIFRALEAVAKALESYEREAGWRTIIPAVTHAFDGAGILAPRSAPIYQLASGDPASGYFSKELVNRMIVGAQRAGKKLAKILLSPEDLADIREWTDADVDPITRAHIFQAKDNLKDLWNIELQVVDDLGIRGIYNIHDRTSKFGPFNGRASDNSFNDYHITHGNILDENGNLIVAGETQVIGLCEGYQDVLRMPISSYKAHYDWSLLRRQKSGFFGWMDMGMGCLDANHLLMGIIDRYVPSFNEDRSSRSVRSIENSFVSAMVDLLYRR
jgi:hypothetical protein